VRQLGRVPTRLHVADADGKNAIPLSAGEDPAFGRPAWSPDGKRIAFGDRTGWKEPQELYAVDADGRNLTNLTDFGGFCQCPAFSSDGKKLAYVRFKDGEKAEVVVADADGKNPKGIVQGVEPHCVGQPAWRPK
jgi:dipeptidyl aminopeptidase/acylaminoacyl peptidase